MVLMNAGSRARHVASISNVKQGGGLKKAGLPGSPTKPALFHIAVSVRGTSNTLFGKSSGLRFTVNPNVRASRPIGSTLKPVPYWSLNGVNM